MVIKIRIRKEMAAKMAEMAEDAMTYFSVSQ